MAKLNNKKLQTQRNFQSIWHSHPEYIGKFLREDQLIREYIIGTMKAKGWKLSEIIIKRKVKQIHITFQIHNKILKERKRWSKNRLKNRRKLRSTSKTVGSRKNLLGVSSELRIRRIKRLSIKKNKRYLYFQLFLMITELRKMYPNNQISFYIQKTKPLQFNANLINSWIVANLKKKSSHKRALNRIIWKYRKGVEKTKPFVQKDGVLLFTGTRNRTIDSTWNILKKEDKNKLLSWITGNLIYLYNVHKLSNDTSKLGLGGLLNIPQLSTNSNKISSSIESDKDKSREVSRRVPWNKRHKGSLSPLNLFWYKWRVGSKPLSKNKKSRKNKRRLKGKIPINRVRQRIMALDISNKITNNQTQRAVSNGKSNPYGKGSSKDLRRRYHSARGLQTILSKYSTTVSIPQNQLAGVAAGPSLMTLCPLNYSQISSNLVGTKPPRKTKPLSKRFLVSSNQTSKYQSNTSQGFSEGVQVSGSSHKLPVNINQDIRSTWRLARKLPKITRRLGNIRQRLWKLHRNEFNEDTLSLLSYYKLKYLLTKSSYNESVYIGDSSDKSFLWQGKNFVKFLQLHPPLLDHVIKCLMAIPMFTTDSYLVGEDTSNEDQLMAFLTQVWVGFFDYIYQFENSLSKWQGIRILLSGRVGFRKMGRAKKYSRYWGVCKNSSARLPLQYSYSQIHTRYGIIGMKIFVR